MTIDNRPLTIDRLLIANRGEIVSRIIRTCRKMGIESIAVFSDADRDAPFVQEADVAVHIGQSEPSESYLNMDKIIYVAKNHNASAIHPGYGFLSENAEFAKRCAAEKIIFIGPHPEAIEQMGSKSPAKELMMIHNIPVIPGYNGNDQSTDKLKAEAILIGFPLLLKAAAGGGGKGMRIVNEKGELDYAIAAAQREALSAFGNDQLIIEKYITSGRHIEFQIFGDQHGHVIHLLERECSIQRRYQKVIEESPSPYLSPELRNEMGQAAIEAAQAINYDNAGTVEFIVDDQSAEFYFLEVNTRLQVEHPVTEEITGLDLVQMQIESAQGMPLSIQQEDVNCSGYAIEARLYAENPHDDFRPGAGRIELLQFPEVSGLRIESGVQSGSDISIFYDPMIAKIIVLGNSRAEAHRKMSYALKHMICMGLQTNQQFLLSLFNRSDFLNGKYNTQFIKDNQEQLLQSSVIDEHYPIACKVASIVRWNQRQDDNQLLSNMPSGWRNSFYSPQIEEYQFHTIYVVHGYRIKDNKFHFDDKEGSIGNLITVNGHQYTININDVTKTYTVLIKEEEILIHEAELGYISFNYVDRLKLKKKKTDSGGYISPMPCQIVKVAVQEGQQVNQGDPLLVISSMKMESSIEAHTSGTVREIHVSEGQNVAAGFELIKIEE